MNDLHETTPPVEPSPASGPPETQPTSDTPHENGTAPRWHAEAGRKGARRVHQLIESGRRYEQEHGLKRGRQRLRQLIELGKLYEQEHGLRPTRRKDVGDRLSKLERDDLMATLLHCLVRLAKPSFRADLGRLIAALPTEKPADAA